jgi:hypothetical protein
VKLDINSTIYNLRKQSKLLGSKKSYKGSTRTRRIFSGRDYYRLIVHVLKYPETKFQVLNPTGTYPAGLPKIENWPKMVLYMGL